jgi:hypothetical protein
MDEHLEALMEGRRAWDRAWRALRRKERKAVEDAVQRGLALPDIASAAMAIGYIRFTRRRAEERTGWGIPEIFFKQLKNAEEANLTVLGDEGRA